MATATIQGRTAAGATAAAGAVVLWGFAGVLVKLTSANAPTIVMYRMFIGTVVLLALMAILRRRPTWQGLRRTFVSGVFFGVTMLFFFMAVKRTNIADVALIGALHPLLVMAGAGRFFGERLGARKVLCAAASVCGVGIVVYGSSQTPTWSLSGDLFALASVATWNVFWMRSKRVRETLPTLEYMMWTILVAGLVTVPVALALGGSPVVTRPLDWIWLVLLAVGPGFGGHGLMVWAHRYLEVSVSSVIAVGEIVVATAAAIVVLNEPVRGVQLVGGILALAAIVAVMRAAAGEDAAGGAGEAPAET